MRKIFRVDRAENSLNYRVITSAEVPAGTWKTFKTTHPASIIVYCAVGDDWGKAHIHVVPKGQTINTDNYLKISEETVIPWAKCTFRRTPMGIASGQCSLSRDACSTSNIRESNQNTTKCTTIKTY